MRFNIIGKILSVLLAASMILGFSGETAAVFANEAENNVTEQVCEEDAEDEAAASDAGGNAETESSVQSLTVDSGSISINATEVTIYGLDTWEEELLLESLITIPSGFAESFQLEVTGASSVSYSVISGDSVTVSSAGLILPVYETWYYTGSAGSNIETESYDYIESEGVYGSSVIEVTADSVTFTVYVEFVDYGDYYVEKIMEEYIEENITSSMSAYDKVCLICAFIADNYDYDTGYASAKGMILSGGGDCWASTDAVITMCEMVGLEAWSRNGNRDSSAGSGHVNALVADPDTSGVYYEAEAGYTGSAPRTYSVTKRTSLFSYRTVTGGIEVYQYDGNEEESGTLSVPSSIDGKTVVSIGEKFIYGEDWDAVSLPDTITSIDDYAFYGCENLVSFTVPASVASIGSYVFKGCSSLEAIYVASGNSTYASLEGILYDAGLTSILYYPEGKSDTSVDIPASVTYIGYEIFSECRNLEEINVASDNEYYASVDGVVYNKSKTTLVVYPAGKTDVSFTVPEGVTEIGTGAFYECTNVREIILSDTVAVISDFAFSYCESLYSIEFSDSLESIGYYGFGFCTALAYVEFPESLTYIGERAFIHCDELAAAEFSEGLETIDSYAFYGCNSMDTVVIPASVSSIGSYAFGSSIILASDNSFYEKSVVFLGDAPSMGSYVFYRLIPTVYYPCGNSTWTDSIIDAYYGEQSISWQKQHSLESSCVVTAAACTEEGLAEGICEVCKETVSQVIAATGHHYEFLEFLPSTCTENGYVRYKCSVCSAENRVNLSYDIPGSHSFVETETGTVHTYTCSECDYGYSFDSSTGTLTIFGNGKMDNFNLLSSSDPWAPWYEDYADEIVNVVIEDGIEGVGGYAFYGCSSLTSVTLPDSTTSIGAYAFYNCSSLKYIVIPDSVVSISLNSFSGCSSLECIIFEGDAPASMAFYQGPLYGITAAVYYPEGNSTWTQEAMSELGGNITWLSYDADSYPDLCVGYETGIYQIDGTWYYVIDGTIALNYTGFASNSSGTWYVENGIIDFGYTGLLTLDGITYYVSKNFVSTYTGLYKISGEWYYLSGGMVDYSYTGLAKNAYGWWYISGGTIDYSYTGLAKNDYGWWYVSNGKLDTSYTGLAKNAYGWWYVTNGQLDTSYTGLAKNAYGWWYVSNGKLDTSYTGLAKNAYGWWYVSNGQLDTSYTGLAKNAYGWWYVTNGQLDTSYTGLAKNAYGWWYVTNGQLDTSYTGLAKNDYGWWYVTNGQLDTSYTGLAKNAYGTWYVVNGRIASSYSGTVTINGTKYTVKNGMVVS